MNLIKGCFVLCLFVFASGCAQKQYAWNGYDNKLYNHYKSPENLDEFIVSLKEVIDEGEQTGKVPPGIYAEYGFALYEKGNYPEAQKYFKLESDKWPESRVLMAKMISNAQMQGKRGKQAKQTNASTKTATSEVSTQEIKGETK
jgi:hypothetical protein